MKMGNPQSSSVLMERTTGAAVVTVAAKMETVYERVHQLASCNAVVVFSVSGCCMGHVAKQLLVGLGVGPTVVELDRDTAGLEIHALLYRLASAGNEQQQPVPAIFVGGKFLGGIETLIACHINGTLIPLLKDAGALWL
uniref:glutaredoxin-C9-like n=1 Tax=Erigeron canadensis TaxID=72917 RepID=UPI001CB9AACF|nr:glutaredoxin-C9-like [Erigeron canadensis]